MAENLQLDARIEPAEAPKLGYARLPREHRPGKPELFYRLKPILVMDSKLRARVEFKSRHEPPKLVYEPQVLHYERIRALLVELAREIKHTFKLPVEIQRVDGYIAFSLVDMAVIYRLKQLILGEVFGIASCVEISSAHVYGIRTVLYSGNKTLPASRRREQFQMCFFIS